MMSNSRARVPLHFTYEMDGALIPSFKRIRDLGVEMLTFRNHIVKTLVTSLWCRFCTMLLTSHLEATAMIWNLYKAK